MGTYRRRARFDRTAAVAAWPEAINQHDPQNLVHPPQGARRRANAGDALYGADIVQ